MIAELPFLDRRDAGLLSQERDPALRAPPTYCLGRHRSRTLNGNRAHLLTEENLCIRQIGTSSRGSCLTPTLTKDTTVATLWTTQTRDKLPIDSAHYHRKRNLSFVTNDPFAKCVFCSAISPSKWAYLSDTDSVTITRIVDEAIQHSLQCAAMIS